MSTVDEAAWQELKLLIDQLSKALERIHQYTIMSALEALRAVVADKVVGGHIYILTELRAGVERGGKLLPWLPQNGDLNYPIKVLY